MASRLYQTGIPCDRHPVYISELERGVKIPSLETILRISEALDISPGDLINLSFRSGQNETSEIRNQIMVLLNQANPT